MWHSVTKFPTLPGPDPGFPMAGPMISDGHKLQGEFRGTTCLLARGQANGLPSKVLCEEDANLVCSLTYLHLWFCYFYSVALTCLVYITWSPVITCQLYSACTSKLWFLFWILAGLFFLSTFDVVGNELVYAPEPVFEAVQQDPPMIQEWSADDIEWHRKLQSTMQHLLGFCYILGIKSLYFCLWAIFWEVNCCGWKLHLENWDL